MIGFDNAIEVCVDTFVGLHPRHRGGYQIRREDREPILRTFHSKVEFLERYALDRGVSLGDVSIDDIVWYHQLRNELYHSGNGMTPERKHLEAIREGARSVFRALFDCDVVAEPTGGQPDEPPPPPPDSSSGLAFLSTYIAFERALSRWSKSSKAGYLPQMWQEFRSANRWAAEFDELVADSRRLRNAVAHGEDRSSGASTSLDPGALARDLSVLTQRISETPVPEQRQGAAPALRGRRLAVRAYAAAKEADPNATGLTSVELTDLLLRTGVRIKGENPGRTTYDAVNAADDLFEHAPCGRYRWRDAPTATDGLSGAELREAIHGLGEWMAVPEGPHYQEIVARLESKGVAVKGPDKGRTVNATLNSVGGRGLFSRVGRGRYRLATTPASHGRLPTR